MSIKEKFRTAYNLALDICDRLETSSEIDLVWKYIDGSKWRAINRHGSHLTITEDEKKINEDIIVMSKMKEEKKDGEANLHNS